MTTLDVVELLGTSPALVTMRDEYSRLEFALFSDRTLLFAGKPCHLTDADRVAAERRLASLAESIESEDRRCRGWTVGGAS